MIGKTKLMTVLEKMAQEKKVLWNDKDDKYLKKMRRLSTLRLKKLLETGN